MIVDKTENVSEQAWTKLLDDKDTNGAVIVKNTNDTDSSNPKESPLSMDPPQTKSKESILGTFHRHLRMSLKAVSESPGPITRYRQTRFSSRRVRKRVIFKHGDCNVVQGNVAKRRRRYLQDIFTTLVDAQWRWTLLVFALSFLLSWTAFGFVWWTIAYAHGDLEYIHLREQNEEAAERLNFTMCVTEIRSLTSAFLYSIETQHTIGYGNRFVTEECPEAIFTMCFQCIMGVFIQAFMVGIVFAKLSRPKKRAQTLLFSRNAVICHRDGVPCLMFRVGDMRKSHIIEAHVRAQIIRKKVTKEGEIMPFYQQELTVGADGGEDRLMFIWPTTIVHKIDRKSPLYTLSASDMLKERFEVVVMLEGVIESTGMTTQARSSYLPSEILWGHRFVNVVSFRKETGEYEVDYTLFNNTYDVDTPLCSSRQLDEVKAEFSKNSKTGLERALSAGILPRISSAASLDPASDESLDSGRLHMRAGSIPNGILPNDDADGHSINNNNITCNTALLSPNGITINSINEKSRSKSVPRRLSIKQNQLSVDSIC
ncbi:G protein-activated inward rectifier potassium channel 3 isoform X2 [Episyrphus balteatus]|uniref:G protein-activated inward rectifier potassium channel 3 isoform X2 n=1 Tax=Episyrphus balteatus TaxID=286459 RepID=UPI002485A21D|nr:G protein-activated inward rectifier potassium channel 3 isoform X2 [Episyrphus balteatus]